MNVTDDVTTTADGIDTYHLVKTAGRYKSAFVKSLILALRTVFRLFVGLTRF